MNLIEPRNQRKKQMTNPMKRLKMDLKDPRMPSRKKKNVRIPTENSNDESVVLQHHPS